MENKVLIAISTYKKNTALTELLDTMKENGYLDSNDVLICDDGAPGAKEVWKKYNQPNIFYTGGSNVGISRNKNRGIKFFLENKQYTHLVLLDDDLLFTRPGMIEAMRATGQHHLTGYLGTWIPGYGIKRDEREQLSGNTFIGDFPVQGEAPGGTYYCLGAQGIMLFLTREIVEKAMYFHVPPGKYGYEHSIYTNVINTCMGIHMDWFPVFKNTPKYLIGNYNHPNNYDVGKVGDGKVKKNDWHIEKNSAWWQKKKIDIYNGINYINKQHQVPEGEEILKHG